MGAEPAGVDSPAARTSGGTVVAVLLWREMVRFRRQPARVLAAIGTPLLLWFMLASGFAGSFSASSAGDGNDYGRFLLPGMITLVAVFTAIFSTISIIDDRNEGWLQSVLVSPAPRWSIAMGKIAGGTVVAFVQSAMLIALAPIIGISLSLSAIALVLFAILLTSIAMTGLGSVFAWRCETTQGFHAVMNLMFMPMWLLSGAFFPIEGAAGWLGTLMQLNPLTWCTEAVRDGLNGHANTLGLVIAAAFAIAMCGATTVIASMPSRRA